jgi:hypothetical protein
LVLSLLAGVGCGLGCGAVHGLGGDGAAAAGTAGASAGTSGGAGSSSAGGIGGTAGASAGTGGGAGSSSAGGTGGGEAGAAGGGAGTGGSCTVKINEVQTGGTVALDEFIELYNACPDGAFDLSGYALVYRSATGTSDVPRVAFTATQIAAGKPYFVCANTAFAGTADVRYTDGLAADGGGLALRAPDGRIVDAVGWGTASNAFVEGAAAPVPQPGQSIARVPDGHDSDHNQSDFTVAAVPTPGAPN